MGKAKKPRALTQSQPVTGLSILLFALFLAAYVCLQGLLSASAWAYEAPRAISPQISNALTREEKRALIRAYVRYFIEQERVRPPRHAAVDRLEQDRLAALAKLAEALAAVWVPRAEASTALNGCVAAMWVGTQSSSGCQLPAAANKYKSQCTAGHEPCNPGLTGGQKDGSAICVSRAGGNNWSERCQALGNKYKAAGNYREPTDSSYADEFNQTSSSLNTLNPTAGTRDLNFAINQTVGKVESERARLAGGAVTPTGRGPAAETRSDVPSGAPEAGGATEDRQPAGVGLKASKDALTPDSLKPSLQDPATGGGQGAVSRQGGPSTPAAGRSGNDPTLPADRDTSGYSNEKVKAQREQVTEDGRNQRTLEREYNAADMAKSKAGGDPCRFASTVDRKKYGCGDTQDLMDYAKIANIGGQAVGAIATQVQGAQAMTNAQSQGTQSGALRAAANTQASSGNMQMMLGIVNAAAGGYQIMKAQEHKKTSTALEESLAASHLKQTGMEGTLTQQGAASAAQHGYIGATEGTDADKMMRNFELDQANNNLTAVTAPQFLPDGVTPNPVYKTQVEARRAQAERNKLFVMKKARGIAAEASAEHADIGKKAMTAGVGSMITGLQQTMTGFFNKKAAEQLQNAADQLKSAENSFTPIQPSVVGAGDALAPRAPQVITGNGAAPAVEAPAEDQTNVTDNSTLGTPINLDGKPEGLAQGPGALKFTPKDPSEAKNGGPAALGGGGTSPSGATANEDPQAKYAAGGSQVNYEGTGGSYRGGGGGGAGGGDKGIDLSGMLAQFLPKKEENGQDKSILDFGGQRAPASEGGGSWLGPEGISLFTRAARAIEAKQRSREVGIFTAGTR